MSELLKLYIDEIEKIPNLTKKEFQTLWRKYKKGNKQAKQKMLISNLKLVIPIAKKYSYSGIDILDLIEEGNFGLIKAIEKYNPRKNVRLSTYASYWIEQYIKRAIERQAKVIKIPSHMWENIKKWVKIWNEFYNKLGRYPSVGEMASELHLSIKQLSNLIRTLELSRGILQLEQPVDQFEEMLLKDILPDNSVLSPEKLLFKTHLYNDIKKLLDKLPKRERKVLEMRYGLKGGKKYTLEETGREIKISRERVRQLEKRALYKLKWLAYKMGVLR